MSDPSCFPTASHELCITVSLDRTLTIEFPHPEWAEYFRKQYSQNDYHDNVSINEKHTRHVHMALPSDVNRVQVRGPGARMVLAFNDKSSAKDWLDNSKLWQSTDDGYKVALKTKWSHQDFDAKMGCNTSKKVDIEGRNQRTTGSAISYSPPPDG